MTEPADVTPNMLRRIDEKLDRVIEGVRDGHRRSQAGIHRRLERVDTRLELIERGLELA